MSRALWIDEGDDPRWDKLAGFTHLSFSYRDPKTPAAIPEARRRGFQPCIHVGHLWFPLDAYPSSVAKTISEYWLKFGGREKNLPVQFDFEQHDAEWLAAFFGAWRKLRPWLQTSWSLEGFQGGGKWGSWLSPIRDKIIAANVQLVPNAYGGEMEPFDPRGVVLDLVEAGFPADHVVPFHDAERLYRGWDGWAFTQKRLP